MEKIQKIIAVIGEADFEHMFFKGIEPADILAAKSMIEKGVSFPVTFYDGEGKILFYAVFDHNDFYPDALHVNILTGHFLRFHQFFASFCFGLAKHHGKKKVTFKTKKRVVRNYAVVMGFEANQYGDYERAV